MTVGIDSMGRDITRAPFDNILNLRDVGKTVNGFTGSRLVVEGLLYRSARPDDATLSDRRRLQTEIAINTVMDLRTKSEHTKQARKRKRDVQTSALLELNDALAEPMKIPGIKYLEINLNGKGFERSLLWQLPIWSLIPLIYIFVSVKPKSRFEGSRLLNRNCKSAAHNHLMEAISILGREVMQPRGLIGLGRDSIDYCGLEIAQAFRELATPDRYPILIHCTQGKDRTGLLVALLLILLDVPLDAITYDYCLSESELLPEQESRIQEIKEIGLTEDFAKTPKNWIPELHQYLEQQYGGATEYLSNIGVDSEMQARILNILQVKENN